MNDSKPRRELAAIVAADVANFSMMTGGQRESAAARTAIKADIGNAE
jgi:hypothetical protein